MKIFFGMLGTLFCGAVLIYSYHFIFPKSAEVDVKNNTVGTETVVPQHAAQDPDERSEEELIGQLFMIGHWAGTPVASTTALIRDYHIGGVIIMSAPDDPKEIASWVDEWQEASDVPLLIAIDQEGGPVSRLKGVDFIQTSQREVETEVAAYDLGRARGAELRALGVNMNFAPVLDVAKNPDSFMYTRVFKDSERAGAFASSMLEGFRSAGVIGVPKHFPGHDDTSDDSHTTLPVVNITKEELDVFTQSFREVVSIEQPAAIMTAHVLFPDIDSLPATLSHFFLTEYLREELGFEGVIITDGMSMDAIDDTWGAEEASVLALRAGADMVLFAAEPERVVGAIEAVRRAVEEDLLSVHELTLHYERVTELHAHLK